MENSQSKRSRIRVSLLNQYKPYNPLYYKKITRQFKTGDQAIVYLALAAFNSR